MTTKKVQRKYLRGKATLEPAKKKKKKIKKTANPPKKNPGKPNYIPPQIELETVRFIAGLLKEKYPGVSRAAFLVIARDAIKQDKILEDEWTEKRIQQYVDEHRQSGGRFILFSEKQKAKFIEAYGVDSFSFLARHLNDLRFISPQWAANFMAVVTKIGVKTVEAQPSVYEFVMKENKSLFKKLKHSRREVYSS